MLGIAVLAAFLTCGKLWVGDQLQPMDYEHGLASQGHRQEQGALCSPGLQERSLGVRCGFRCCRRAMCQTSHSSTWQIELMT